MLRIMKILNVDVLFTLKCTMCYKQIQSNRVFVFDEAYFLFFSSLGVLFLKFSRSL